MGRFPQTPGGRVPSPPLLAAKPEDAWLCLSVLYWPSVLYGQNFSEERKRTGGICDEVGGLPRGLHSTRGRSPGEYETLREAVQAPSSAGHCDSAVRERGEARAVAAVLYDF